MGICSTRLRIAEAVASRWRELTEGGSYCTEMSGRLAGAFDAAGLPWRILDLSDRVGAENALDFHYAVESDARVYDLTYRQFEVSAPVPNIRDLAAILKEWRDVRTASSVGWMRERMEEGAQHYRAFFEVQGPGENPGGSSVAEKPPSAHIVEF